MTDGKAQAQMAWQNHFPYMQNFQGPGLQQPPPFHGYPFPYYHGHDREHDDRRNYKKSSCSKKKSLRRDLESLKQDKSAESSDSSSDSEWGEDISRKGRGKKSSRKVVIRNINYITSTKDEERGGNFDEADDEEVGLLEKRQNSTLRQHRKLERNTESNNAEGGKRNGNWDIFQSLLLKDEDTSSAAEPHDDYIQGEYSSANKSSNISRSGNAKSNDSFVVAKTSTGNEGRSQIENFEAGQNVRQIVRKFNSAPEEMLFARRTEDSHDYVCTILPNYNTGSTPMKARKEGDPIIADSQLDRSPHHDHNLNIKFFDGNGLRGGKSKKEVLADDSFMVQAREIVHDQSSVKTDISFVPEIIDSTLNEKTTQDTSQDQVKAFATNEPNDLYMVLDRESIAEQGVKSWTPEMDYESNIVPVKANENKRKVETTKAKGTAAKGRSPAGGKLSNSRTSSNSSLSKSKSDIVSRSKKPTSGSRSTVNKSKLDKVQKLIELCFYAVFMHAIILFKCWIIVS